MSEEYEVRAIPYYTKEHTWARVMADGTVKIGVTDYAQKKLKEIVFVELPEVGSEVKRMEPFGTMESVKAVSELYSPVSGKVKEVNERVIENPNIINRDPYDTGWLITVEPTNLEEELKNLLDAETYKKLLKELEES